MISIPEDFSSEPVPQSARLSSFRVLLIWLGFVLVVGIMAIGGGLAGQMDRSSLVISILVGNLILGILASFTGYIGARSGLTFNMLMSQAFPGFSWRIVSLYVPIVLVGWYAVESALFANYVSQVLGWGIVGQHILMVVAAIGFSISAYLGFRTLGFVSMVLVPIIVLLGIFSIFHIYTGDNLVFGFGDTHISTLSGISIVVSSWIVAVLLCIPDLTRFSRSPRAGAIVAFLGIFIGNIFNFFIGVTGAAMTRQFDPAIILASLGFVFFGLLFSFANIWSTNDNNLYSAALNVSRMANLPRKKAVLWCTVIGAIIAAFNPANLPFLFTVLIFMGNTAPALGGVVLGRYVLSDLIGIKVHDNAWAGWGGWIIGSALAFWVGGNWAMPVGLVTGFVIWWVSSVGLSKVGNNKIQSHL